MLKIWLLVLFFVWASCGWASETESAADIRRLRLQGSLDHALELAATKLDRDSTDARLEIELRLEMARILDRMGLHTNTRPVLAALAQIDAADSVAGLAGLLPSPDIELARADYFYRLEMQAAEFPTATVHARRAGDLYQAIGNGHGEADAVHKLGLIHMQRGELEEARDLFERSLELDHAAGEREFFRGEFERHVGFVIVFSGDIEAAIPYFERSLQYRRRAGAIDASLFAARTLAWALVQEGRHEEAKRHLLYAMTIAEHIDSPVGRARCGMVLGRILLDEGDHQGARTSWETTLEISETVGSVSMAKAAKDALRDLPGSEEPLRDNTGDRKVVDAVLAFGKAFAQADVPALQAHLAPDYVHVNGRSGNVLGGDAWLEWIGSRRARLDQGDLSIDTYEVNNLKVQVLGPTAVVTGEVRSTGRDADEPFVSRIRFTNGWVRSGEVWLRITFIDSPLP